MRGDGAKRTVKIYKNKTTQRGFRRVVFHFVGDKREGGVIEV